MDNLAEKFFRNELDQTAQRLMETIADIRNQLNLLEDSVKTGTPVAGSRVRQVLSLASDAAVAAGTLDVMVRWGAVITPDGQG